MGLCWGGQAGSQRKLGAARSRVRGRGGARRGVRAHGPRSQAQSGGAARRRCNWQVAATLTLWVSMVALRGYMFYITFELTPSRAKRKAPKARGLRGRLLRGRSIRVVYCFTHGQPADENASHARVRNTGLSFNIQLARGVRAQKRYKVLTREARPRFCCCGGVFACVFCGRSIKQCGPPAKV